MAYTSSTLSAPSSVCSSIRPAVDEAALAAAQATGDRAVLLQQLAALEHERRVLAAMHGRRDEQLQQLRDGLRLTVQQTECEEEKMTNVLQKRLLEKQHQQRRLQAQLAKEAEAKATLTAKLTALQAQNRVLAGDIQREEDGIVARLRKQLSVINQQRDDLRARLASEKDITRGEHVGHLRALKDAFARPPTPAVDKAEHAAALEVAAALRTAQRSAPLAHDRSMKAMLTKELGRLRQVQQEQRERAQAAQAAVEGLRVAVQRAQEDRAAQQAALETLRSELDRTTSEAHELSAIHEVMYEQATDREMLRSSCATPDTALDSTTGEFTRDGSALRGTTPIAAMPALCSTLSPGAPGTIGVLHRHSATHGSTTQPFMSTASIGAVVSTAASSTHSLQGIRPTPLPKPSPAGTHAVPRTANDF